MGLTPVGTPPKMAATGVTFIWTNEQKVLRGQERRFKVMVMHPHSQSVPFSDAAGMPNPRSRGQGVNGMWGSLLSAPPWGPAFQGLGVLQEGLRLKVGVCFGKDLEAAIWEN